MVMFSCSSIAARRARSEGAMYGTVEFLARALISKLHLLYCDELSCIACVFLVSHMAVTRKLAS